MKQQASPEVAKQQDARSQELIEEFNVYRDEIIAENPDDPKLSNPRIIFESWALQKIAGLQCALQDLAKEVHKKGKRKSR